MIIDVALFGSDFLSLMPIESTMPQAKLFKALLIHGGWALTDTDDVPRDIWDGLLRKAQSEAPPPVPEINAGST